MFRRTRGRQDLLSGVKEFKHHYYGRKKLTSVGWKELETDDGWVIYRWDFSKKPCNLTLEARGGLAEENGWPKVPLAINNEEIVGLQESSLESFRGCKDQDDVYNYINILKFEKVDSRLYQEVGSYSGLYFNRKDVLCGWFAEWCFA